MQARAGLVVRPNAGAVQTRVPGEEGMKQDAGSSMDGGRNAQTCARRYFTTLGTNYLYVVDCINLI